MAVERPAGNGVFGSFNGIVYAFVPHFFDKGPTAPMLNTKAACKSLNLLFDFLPHKTCFFFWLCRILTNTQQQRKKITINFHSTKIYIMAEVFAEIKLAEKKFLKGSGKAIK